MQRYVYAKHSAIQPGTIRLLKLLPGSAKSDIEANLLIRWIRVERGSTDNRTIVDPEPYQAPSYTWGPKDEASDFSLKILAHSESFYIPIRRNLEAALRQLRHKDQASYWWVDALCINQDDEDEKSMQTPLMSLIYSKAESVCVWLGPEDAASAQAIEFIKKCLVLDDFDGLSERGEIVEHLFTPEALMSSMSAFEASDPHDILYAVLWLANDAEPVTKNAPRREGLRPQNWVDGNLTPALRSPTEIKMSESLAFPDSIAHRRTDTTTNGYHEDGASFAQSTPRVVIEHHHSDLQGRPQSIIVTRDPDGHNGGAD
ncbi:hypothetical protein LTR36_010150 [Oleoguttula mirabilis]|uniref:Heterokaryon incompatibility domain-containing protein n=1 Tax=Oleoguttula mirabilis TaxID=1507867 RepID=A0AAV9JSQ5_9PEZI|nr:hypothetical protein LTR36_010150 [Oleoguttula mirabilis]